MGGCPACSLPFELFNFNLPGFFLIKVTLVNEGMEKFVELENRIYRIIEVHKATRVQKEALEKECQKLKHLLEQAQQENQHLREEIREAEENRQLVRDKVQSLLARLDQLGMTDLMGDSHS